MRKRSNYITNYIPIDNDTLRAKKEAAARIDVQSSGGWKCDSAVAGDAKHQGHFIAGKQSSPLHLLAFANKTNLTNYWFNER